MVFYVFTDFFPRSKLQHCSLVLFCFKSWSLFGVHPWLYFWTAFGMLMTWKLTPQSIWCFRHFQLCWAHHQIHIPMPVEFDKTKTNSLNTLYPPLPHSVQSCSSSWIFSLSCFDITVQSTIQIRVLEIILNTCVPSTYKSIVTS